jgi:uncharacterized protein
MEAFPKLPAFHLMAKPCGPQCNLACGYCFYLPKKALYPKSGFRMPDTILEAYVQQTIEGHLVPEVTFAWQGGNQHFSDLHFLKKSWNCRRNIADPVW